MERELTKSYKIIPISKSYCKGLKPVLKPIIVLTTISIMVFWYCSQFMPLTYSFALTIFVLALAFKLMLKKGIIQKAFAEQIVSLSQEEIGEYSKTPHIKTRLPTILYTTKQWKSLSDDAQYQLIHEYEVILTDHQTMNEKIRIILKKINKKNYVKAIEAYKKFSVNSHLKSNSSSSKISMDIGGVSEFINSKKKINFGPTKKNNFGHTKKMSFFRSDNEKISLFAPATKPTRSKSKKSKSKKSSSRKTIKNDFLGSSETVPFFGKQKRISW